MLNGFISLAIYIAVASPSMVGFVASITSFSSGFAILPTSSFIFSISGVIESIGDMVP